MSPTSRTSNGLLTRKTGSELALECVAFCATILTLSDKLCIYIHNKKTGHQVTDSHNIIKRLKADGWVEIGITGSHHHLKHPEKPGKVTVPHPKKDLPKGTVRSIEKQAGWR